MTAPSTRPRLTRFTTHAVATHQRIEAWEHYNRQALIPLNIRTINGEPLRARQTTVNLPSISVSEVVGSSLLVERTTPLAAAAPLDALAVFIGMVGDAFFFHDGGQMLTTPRQLILADPDRPFARGFPRGLRELVVTVPRRLLPGRLAVPLAEPVHLDFGPGADEAPRRAAQALITRVEAALADAEQEDPAAVEAQLLGSTIHLLDTLRDQTPVAVAKAFIDTHLADTSLTCARIAAAAGLSERQLNRRFDQEDSSISHHLTTRRIELAQSLLRDPGRVELSIGEIAARAGFASHSHFGRAFKRHVGMTPRQWRGSGR